MTPADTFKLVVDSEIKVVDLVNALDSIGYALQPAADGALRVVKRDGRKRPRKKRDETLTGCQVTPVGLVPIFDGKEEQ